VLLSPTDSIANANSTSFGAFIIRSPKAFVGLPRMIR